MIPKLEPSEAEFQHSVTELATLWGWRVLHIRRSIDGHDGRWRTTTSIAGWPDILAWRPGQVIAAELKSEAGRLTRQQKDVLASLADAGIECFVWRPADWAQLESVLRPDKIASDK